MVVPVDPDVDGPHQGQPRVTGGAPIDAAEAAVVLAHGRGATAQGMLGLAQELDVHGVTYVGPQAARRTWYPNSFLEPIETNEPGLSSGLRVLRDVLADLESEGIPAERTAFVGFSQGACLASEFLARNPRRYGGLAALSGGVIGPEGTPRDYEGSLDRTPVFVGCSDVDPHIPIERVHETTEVFEALDADVTERIYEGMGHTIVDDEIDHVRGMLERLVE